MVMNSTNSRNRAEQRLAELQNTTAAAMSYIELEREAIRAKTARLRKQRLEKEAEARPRAPKPEAKRIQLSPAG